MLSLRWENDYKKKEKTPPSGVLEFVKNSRHRKANVHKTSVHEERLECENTVHSWHVRRKEESACVTELYIG